MAKSRDWEELMWAWQEWRSETGKKMKSNYIEFVELLNKAARMNGKNACFRTLGMGPRTKSASCRKRISHLPMQSTSGENYW